MHRYLRLYAYFIRFAFSRAMEFRVDFFFRIFMDMSYYAVNLTFFTVVYRHVTSIAGWREDQALVFVAGYLLVDAVSMTLFSNNHWQFTQLVNRGDLDYFLVRPISTFFFISFRDFAANSFLNLLMTLGIMAWAIGHCQQTFTAGSIALYLMLLMVGVFLHHAMFMMFMIPVFWAHRVDGLRMLALGLSQLGERPHRVYSRAVQRVLLSILPSAMIASVPATVLFEGMTIGIAANIVGVCIGFYGVLMLFWRAGLRAYSSASS